MPQRVRHLLILEHVEETSTTTWRRQKARARLRVELKDDP